MGMSSSQARLLSLTARLHDIEYKAQKLEAEKLRLANNSTRIYEDYLQALDATKIQYSALTCDGSITYLDATLNALENGVISGYDGETSNEILFLQNQDGAIIVTPAVAEKYGLVEGQDLGTLDDYLTGLGFEKSIHEIYSEREVTDYDTITGFTKIANIENSQPVSNTTYTYNPVENIVNAEIITTETSTLNAGLTYVIDSAEGLVTLAKLVNNGATTEGITIIMTADIDMSGVDWEGIGTSSNTFQGTFDGNGYTISNLTGSQGLFGYTSNAEIFNVSIVDANIDSTNSKVGALIGSATNTTVDNCSVSGTVTSSDRHVGGAIGDASNCTITNSTSNCTVNCTRASGGETYVGGFVGEDKNSTYNNCIASGTVNNTGTYSGGFVGLVGGGATSTFENCSTSVDLYLSSSNQCGTFGSTYNATVNLSNCEATGSIYYGTSSSNTFFYNSKGTTNNSGGSSSATGASDYLSKDVIFYTIPSTEDYIQNIIAVLTKAGSYDPCTASEDEENAIKSKIEAFLNNFVDNDTDNTKLYYLNEAIVAYLNGTGSSGLGETLVQDIENGTTTATTSYQEGEELDGSISRGADTITSVVEAETESSKGEVTIPSVSNIATQLYYALKQAGYSIEESEVTSWINSNYSTSNGEDKVYLANINDSIQSNSNLASIYSAITGGTKYEDDTLYSTDEWNITVSSEQTITPTYGTTIETYVSGQEEYWDMTNSEIANAIAVWTMAQRGGFIIATEEQAASTTWLTNMIEVGAAVFTTFDISKADALTNYSSEEIINMSEAEYNDLMGIQNTSVSTNTSLREVSDETNLKKAEAKYEADMKKIDLKDRRYDTDLAAIETEREAIVDEIDTLKTVAKDNVDRTFKLFS